MYTAEEGFTCTHHEEDAEVGQLPEEVLHADRVGVKGEEAADGLVELLHVLMHGRQLFVLLPRVLAEAVRAPESRKRRKTFISNAPAIFKGDCNQRPSDISQMRSSAGNTGLCEK